MNESALPLAPRAVVSLSAARSCDDVVDDEDGDDGRAKMRVAKSSYFAWVSRGFWPKRPKAHGAAVDVGNKEKGAEEDEDISGASVVQLVEWLVKLGGRSLLFSLCRSPNAVGGVKRVRACEGHALLAYIPARMVGVGGDALGNLFVLYRE